MKIETPPYSGSLAFYCAWAKEHGGTVAKTKGYPTITITAYGIRHVHIYNKWKRDRKYSWSSSMPIDFMARCVAAHMAAHPHDGVYAK